MKKTQLYVTESFLPPIGEFKKYVDDIWSTKQLTNQGPLVKRLESELERKLKVRHLQLVTNGTVAIQLALRALEITEGEVITTPFSYVATTSAILWEHLTPVFVDIDPKTLCIDPSKIEAAITPNTKAILAVHVFGYPCDVEAIDKIARRHNLKVIYDAAHVFGATYKGKSLLDYGDASTCSFHATKVFHTIEGGCVVLQNEESNYRLELIKRFGHHGDTHVQLGINGKMSEFNAAMGLSILPHFADIIKMRKNISEQYDFLLGNRFEKPLQRPQHEYNYYAYPIIFESENALLSAVKKLNKDNIFPRRYFYPSLNKLPYLKSIQECPFSESISQRVLCLPLSTSINSEDIVRITKVLLS